jgi:hypothetical protein
MYLPCCDEAIVDREKLWNYLLSPTHRAGRHKAAFFKSLGFDRLRCDQLESALRWHAAQEGTVVEDTLHGRKFVIRASLTGPAGRTAQVTSVWIIRHGQRAPRFVTAYPGSSP